MANRIFENRIECGRWVAHVIDKHAIDTMAVIAPLHGADYLERITEQKDNWTQIFEQVLPIMINQGFMPMKFLKQIVEATTEDRIKNAGPLTKKFDEFLSRKGYKNVEKAEQAYYKISQGPKMALEKDKGAVRRITAGSTTFDFRLISNDMWDKKKPITKDTLELHDFAQEAQELDTDDLLFAKRKNHPVYPVYPVLDDELE
jgi:hypothetical protein